MGTGVPQVGLNLQISSVEFDGNNLTVCGEDCSIQRCPLCASSEEKEKIVDFILSQTLGEIPPEACALDELIITLPDCLHSFTVETLDGHCGMNEYYEREGEDGRWLSLKAPNAANVARPPVCPTCRAQINSPRYGRVYKCADLDISEKNVISSMTLSLNRVQEALNGVSKQDMETRLDNNASMINSQVERVTPKKIKGFVKKRVAILRETREVPSPTNILNPGNPVLYFIDPVTAKQWSAATQKLTRTYQDVMKIANTRSAHLNAWQSAVSYIYESEMNRATSDPSRAPRNPIEFAMRTGTRYLLRCPSDD